MSTEQRIRALEEALPAQMAVRRWLVEAHTFGSAEAYGEWLAGQPDDADPHRRLRAQVETATRQATPARSTDGPLAAWEAGRDTLFLVELVATVNERVEGLVVQGVLRADWLDAELRCLRLEARTERSAFVLATESGAAEAWTDWCLAYSLLAIMLATAEEARVLLETRYLGGASTLFPDLAEAWTRLRTRVGDLGASSVQGDGHVSLLWPPDPRPVVLLARESVEAGARAHALVAAADLVDVAHARTLGYVGDRAGAAAIEARRRRHGVS